MKWFVIGVIVLAIIAIQFCGGEQEWWQSSSLYQIYPRSFKDSNGDGIGDIKAPLTLILTSRHCFYVWHPGFPDPNNASRRLPPNNWVSVFRGPAWTWREERQQFYLHQFVSKQPDLNYRNPKVVEQMKDVLIYWYKRGVDGFRIDAVPHLFEIARDSNGNFKDEPWSGLTNDTNDYEYLEHIYTTNQPETIDMVYQWRKVTDDFVAQNGGETKVLLTEAYSSIGVIMQYYGNGTHEGAHIPFNFMFINDLGRWSNAYDYKNVINTWMFNMPQGRTANWVLGNHDRPRVGTRFGKERIELLNMLMMVLPGVTITYYGEEVGMTDVYIPWEETVDPAACNTNPEIFQSFNRDPCRTPFQWDDSTSAGFSINPKTWLRVAEDYRMVNVKREEQFVKSHLQTYIRAKRLRETATIKNGGFGVWAANDRILIIKRDLADQPSYIFIANIGGKLERTDLTSVVSLPETLQVVVSSVDSPRRIGDVIKSSALSLVPYEALIVKT